ncbi:PIR Superfamily Protein [Plasmodium ovale wallikeri]|uniref:PIR Superfamily Protein n=1 Tax=Plasmodium ovale wallikeri TaxID=864142 RepID=A0A1A9AP61_PLAOA|nr:PIR Superfamily Protein [Plasmodium ovale wallikeri]SBT58461.1 PIR Superfamily Protein [Plasmodium ovale wallikeri]
MALFNDKDYFTYDELKKQYEFLETLTFGKLYKELNDNSSFDRKGKSHCDEIKSELPNHPYDDDILSKFCNNLYKIIVKIKNLNNDIFNGIDKKDKIYCFCLKYWLYDQIRNLDAKGLNINDLFEKWQSSIKSKITGIMSVPCTFRELSWNEYNKLKSIYAFVLLYYNNINAIDDKKFVLCKYLNYFGKGLKAYYESLSECSKGKRDDNYCKEFNEYKELYKLDKVFWKNSTYNTKFIYDADSTDDCPLVIQSVKNPVLIKYIEENNILYLSDQPIDSLNGFIISGSSVAGATVGISAFLFYLFKFTNIRSLFGRGKQTDDTMFLNVDEGSHNFSFPISEQEQANFGNSEYNIAYYSAGNS